MKEKREMANLMHSLNEDPLFPFHIHCAFVFMEFIVILFKVNREYFGVCILIQAHFLD